MGTTVDDRFQVSRHGTGFLCSFRSFGEALGYCLHSKDQTELIIFDIMAHQETPEMWDGWGKIIRERGKP